MHRTGIGALFFLFLVLLNTAATPRFAYSLNEGRTYDQAHDSSFIDWNGNIQYVSLTHRDNTSLPPQEGSVYCMPSCTEWVTRVGNGGSASGVFERDVTYFEIMVGFSPDLNVGSATLQACSSASTWYLHNTSGSLPGFVSMNLTVPAGCRSWSLSASGGYVDFRSVDVFYVPPTPTPTSTVTRTPTLLPTSTHTSTVVPSSTFTPVGRFTQTFTPIFTPTTTYTSTASHTPTPSLTWTPIPTLTYTTTATHTFTPTLTSTSCSNTIIYRNTNEHADFHSNFNIYNYTIEHTHFHLNTYSDTNLYLYFYLHSNLDLLNNPN